MRIGIYPGTFDPVTFGHLDIIERAVNIVDHLIVAVATNDGKSPVFSAEERVALLKADIATLGNIGKKIEITPFGNLLVDFAADKGAHIIIRGLRAISDFEYEFQMAGMNARLRKNIETIFLVACDRHQFTASRLVKEISRLGGDVSSFVTKSTAQAMAKKFS